VLIAVALAVIAPAAHAASPRVRVGTAPVLPRGAQTGATVPDAKQLQLTVALQPRDPAGLQAFATAVSTPSSPLYHQYLSVPEFAQRFGATPAQVSAVRSSLRAQGLTVGEPTANDLSLPVTATAADAERAFSVSLSQVRTSSGRSAYANDQAPAVTAGIAPYVQGVIGLEDVTLSQPQGLHASRTGTTRGAATPQIVTGGPQPCSSATQVQGQPFAYTPDVLATAYGFSPLYLAGDQGAGQTIALYEQQPYQPSDIATFQACMGTSAPVSAVDVDGGPGPYQPPAAGGGGGDGESALDIEVVTGLAPKANVLVYQGPPTATAPVDILTAIISQNRAKVISSSWGACEASTPGAQIAAENTLLQEAAAQGQSFFISSGDSGSEQCSQLGHGDTSLSVLDPAGQPFATGVGGTTLYSGDGDAYAGGTPTESVWNDGPTGNGRGSGSGGGLSKQWPMPAYQATASGSLGVISGSSSGAPCGAPTFCREVPDVSADAALETGYTMFVDGGWTVIGGTSAAAPLWAAFTGLANASSACRGTPVGVANPSHDAIAGSSYLNNFHDVTLASPVTGVANNDVLNGSGPFPTTANYDMTTGIGTPIGGTLAASLCGRASPVYTVAVGNPGTLSGTVGTPLSVQIAGSDTGSIPLTYSASGLPAGLSINPATGVVSGTPSAAATSIVTVTATDQYTNGGGTQFAWTVVPPPAPPKAGPARGSHLTVSGVARRRARLAFTITAGSNAPKVKAITVTLPKGLAFSKSKKRLAKGITVKSTSSKKVKFKVTIKKNMATITLTTAATAAKLGLAYPAVTVTAKEAAGVKHHKIKTLKLAVTVTDAARHRTTLALRARPA
jgi:hypothetical protein